MLAEQEMQLQDVSLQLIKKLNQNCYKNPNNCSIFAPAFMFYIVSDGH